MARRVLRHVIPVDDTWHRIVFTDNSAPVHVGSRIPETVEFWVVPVVTATEQSRIIEFRVFGTGHEIPDGASYVGTTYDHGTDALVWHLFCRTVQEGN